MGKRHHPWQEIDDVLGRFGKQAGIARRRYETFLEDNLPEARKLPTDLLGGGVVQTLKDARRHYRREGDRALYDPRVLGESDFVQRVWTEADERESIQRQFRRKKVDLRRVAKTIAEWYAIDERQLFERGRTAEVSKAKAALIYTGVEALSKSQTEMARWTKMTPAAAGRAKIRGAEVRTRFNSNKVIKLLRP